MQRDTDAFIKKYVYTVRQKETDRHTYMERLTVRDRQTEWQWERESERKRKR